jgi:hypothetical protein
VAEESNASCASEAILASGIGVGAGVGFAGAPGVCALSARPVLDDASPARGTSFSAPTILAMSLDTSAPRCGRARADLDCRHKRYQPVLWLFQRGLLKRFLFATKRETILFAIVMKFCHRDLRHWLQDGQYSRLLVTAQLLKPSPPLMKTSLRFGLPSHVTK